MKKLKMGLITLLIFSIVIMAEEKPKVYNGKCNKSSVEIKQCMMLMLNDMFEDPGNVIKFNEDGVISGKFTKSVGYLMVAEYKFTLQYWNRQYKLEILLTGFGSDEEEAWKDAEKHVRENTSPQTPSKDEVIEMGKIVSKLVDKQEDDFIKSFKKYINKKR